MIFCVFFSILNFEKLYTEEGERRSDGTFAVSGYLSVLYQSGIAGLLAGFCLAVHVWGIRSAGILCRSDFHDYRAGHRDIQPAERPDDPAFGNRKSHGNQCGNDSRRPVRFFCQPFVLAAVSVGYSVWSGGRKCRCLSEQLCGAALQKLPYELASLHVGSGNLSGTVYHGIYADFGTKLEHGVSVHLRASDASDSCSSGDAAVLEAKGRGGKGDIRRNREGLSEGTDLG